MELRRGKTMKEGVYYANLLLGSPRKVLIHCHKNLSQNIGGRLPEEVGF